MNFLNSKSINSKLLPFKIHFFLNALGACAPFINIGTYARQLGYSVDTIGCVTFLFPILSIFMKIGLGIIGDRVKKLKLIFSVSIIISSLSLLCLSFLSKRSDVTSISIFCNENDTIIDLCDLNAKESSEFQFHTRQCQIRCNDNEEFLNMCLKWFAGNSSIENASSAESCDDISGEIEMLNKSVNDCSIGRIQKIHTRNSNSKVLAPHCYPNKYTTCYIDCKENRNSVLHEIQLPEFQFFFTFYLIFCLFACLNDVIGDRICFQALEEKSHTIGKQLLFSSLGWGLAAIGSGFFLDLISNNKIIDKNYKYIYPISSLIYLLDAIVIFFMQVKEDTSTNYNFRAVWKLFHKLNVQLFAFWAFVMGFIFSIHWTYLFWFLEEISSKDDIVWIKSLEGFGTFVSAILAEAPAFYVSGFVIKKLGVTRCMSLVLLLSGIELYFYSIMTKPIIVPIIQFLGGVNYAVGYTTLQSNSNKIAEPGTETTVIAVVHCIFDGLGSSMGSLIGGFLYQWYGGSVLFTIGSLGGILSALFIEIIFKFFIR